MSFVFGQSQTDSTTPSKEPIQSSTAQPSNPPQTSFSFGQSQPGQGLTLTSTDTPADTSPSPRQTKSKSVTFASTLVTGARSPDNPSASADGDSQQFTDWLAVHRAFVAHLGTCREVVHDTGAAHEHVQSLLTSPESSPLLVELSKVLAAFPGGDGSSAVDSSTSQRRFAGVLAELLDYNPQHVQGLIRRFLNGWSRREEVVAAHAAMQKKKQLIARLNGRPESQRKVLAESILRCSSSDELSAVDKVLDRLRVNITDMEATDTVKKAVEAAAERSPALRFGVYISPKLVHQVRQFHYAEIAAMLDSLRLLTISARDEPEGAAFGVVKWLVQKKRIHEVVTKQIKALQQLRIHDHDSGEEDTRFAGRSGCAKALKLELVEGQSLQGDASFVATHLDCWATEKVAELEALVTILREIDGTCQMLFLQGVQQDLFARLNAQVLPLFAGEAQSRQMSALVNRVPMQLASCMRDKTARTTANERLMQAWVALLVQAMDLPSATTQEEEHILSFKPSGAPPAEARFHTFFTQVNAQAHGGLAVMQLAWTIYVATAASELSSDIEPVFNEAYPPAFAYLSGVVGESPAQAPLLEPRPTTLAAKHNHGHFKRALPDALASAVRPLLTGLVAAFRIDERVEQFGDLKLIAALIVASLAEGKDSDELLQVGDGQWALQRTPAQVPMQALIARMIAVESEPGPGLNVLAVVCRSKSIGCLLMERINVIALLERSCTLQVNEHLDGEHEKALYNCNAALRLVECLRAHGCLKLVRSKPLLRVVTLAWGAVVHLRQDVDRCPEMSYETIASAMALLAGLAKSRRSEIALGILEAVDSSLFSVGVDQVVDGDVRGLLYMLDLIVELFAHTGKQRSLKHAGLGLGASVSREQLNRAVQQMGLPMDLPEPVFLELMTCFGDVNRGLDVQKLMRYLSTCTQPASITPKPLRTFSTIRPRSSSSSKVQASDAVTLRCSDELKRTLKVIARTRETRMESMNRFERRASELALNVLSNLWAWRVEPWKPAIRCLQVLIDGKREASLAQLLTKEKAQEALMLSVCGALSNTWRDQRMQERTTLLGLKLLLQMLQQGRLPAEGKIALLCRKLPPAVRRSLNSPGGCFASVVAGLVEFPQRVGDLPSIEADLETSLVALKVLNELVCLVELQRRVQGTGKGKGVDVDGSGLKRRKTSAGLPSLVAVIGDQGVLLQKAVLALVRSEEARDRHARRAALQFVCSCLQFEPALGAVLLEMTEGDGRVGKQSVLLREVVRIVGEDSGVLIKAPDVYASAVGLLRVLWQGQEQGGMNQFGAIVESLRRSERFWTTVAFSLMQGTDNKAASVSLKKMQMEATGARDAGTLVAQLTDHCYRLTAKTLALQILQSELRTKGPVQGTAFYSLLKGFQRNDCDAKWLNEFQSLEYTPTAIPRLVTTAAAAGVDLGAFDKPTPQLLAQGSQRDALLELRLRDYGLEYLHYSTALFNLHAEPGTELWKAVIVFNLSQSLADAQLSLMRAWKGYMENRCLVYWQDNGSTMATLPRTFSLAKQPTLSSPLALDLAQGEEGVLDRGVSLSPSGKSDAQTQSQHWGETTSYTLLMCLSKQLGRVAGEKRYSKDLHQLRYLVEISEMFLSMLHFKLFQAASTTKTNWRLETEPKDSTLLEKRPANAKLPLKRSSPDLPGALDFLTCLISCAEAILGSSNDRDKEPNDTIFEVSLSLFTSMLLLLQDILEDARPWNPELRALADRAVSLVQLAFRAIPRLEDVVVHQCSVASLRETLPRLFEVGLTMLDLLLVRAQQNVRVKVDTTMLHRLHAALSSAAANQFSQEAALFAWFERQKLGKISVKVSVSVATQSNDNMLNILHRNGVRVLHDLTALTDAALVDMGVVRQSDRTRVFDAIRSEQGLQLQKDGEAMLSVAVGKAKSHERNCRLRRLLMLTRIFSAVPTVDVRKAVQALSQDPLLRAFTAAPADALGCGYTLSGARCMVHQVWCTALVHLSTMLRRKQKDTDGRDVDAALDFVAIHRTRILGCLKGFRNDWSVISLAALKEAEETVRLMVALAPCTPKWRLRKELFTPVLSEVSRMLSDLVIGADVSRKVKMLEEFAEAATRKHSKHVPKMCIRARAVTIGERKCNQEHASWENSALDSPQPQRNEASAVGGIECDVSVLHVKLEHRILRIIQLALTLMRSRQLFPARHQLEFDKYTKQRIPEPRWRPAVIPFPLLAKTVNCSLLLAILSYAKQKLRSAVAQNRAVRNKPTGDVCSLLSRKWLDPVAFVIDNALYLLAFSLDLEMHELIRKKQGHGNSNAKGVAAKLGEVSRRLLGGQEKKEPGILDLIERYIHELDDVTFRKVDVQVYKDLLSGKIRALAEEAQQ